MKILVVGGGGREHAVAWKLAQSQGVKEVYVAPGNPGTATVGQNVPVPSQHPSAVVKIAADLGVELVIIGPEAPLVEGVIDALNAAGIPAIGPTQAAAQLEGSKIFSKKFMERHAIPTARFHVAESAAEAYSLLEEFPAPLVVKADGLAAGKGVIIAKSKDEASAAIRLLMEHESLGSAGNRVVLEEFLEGEEVSFIVLTDGLNIVEFPPTQDHKAICDGDQGPNTGGMGAYCDPRILTESQRQQVVAAIVEPTLRGMAAEGAPFHGFLYVGLMMTAAGPKVLEYNVRLGDPEAQALCLALDSDLLDLFLATAQHRLHEAKPRWKKGATICVVLAAANYPARPRLGDRIDGIAEAEEAGAVVFHAGTALRENHIHTAGGRVLGVTAAGESLSEAIDHVYRAAGHIHFDGMQKRSDIGAKGLKRW